MTAAEFADSLRGLRPSFDAPVEEHTAVEPVAAAATASSSIDRRRRPYRPQRRDRHRLVRPAGSPAMAGTAPARTSHQIAPSAYRNPGRCPTAACSSSAPRRPACSSPTSCAAGTRRHARRRQPQPPAARYRGMDVFWWLDRIGSLDRRSTRCPTPSRPATSPRCSSSGGPDHDDLDLATLQPPASGWSAAAAGSTATAPVRRRPATDRRRRPTPGCAASSTQIDGYIDAHGLTARCSTPSRSR